MATRARVEIEITGAEQTAVKIIQIEGAERRLTKAFKDGTITIEKYARSTLRLEEAKKKLEGSTRAVVGSTERMTASQRKASEAAQLLGARIGAELPRAVSRFIGQTSLIGPALAAAFNVSIFVALGAAIIGALANMSKLTDKLFDWSGALKQVNEDVKKNNEILVAHREEMRKIKEQYDLIGLEGIPRLSKVQQQANARLQEAEGNLTRLADKYRQASAASRETTTRTEEYVNSLGRVSTVTTTEFTPAALKAQKRLVGLENQMALAKVQADLLRQGAASTGKELGVALGEEGAKKAAERFGLLNAALGGDLEAVKLLTGGKGLPFLTTKLQELSGKALQKVIDQLIKVQAEGLKAAQATFDVAAAAAAGVNIPGEHPEPSPEITRQVQERIKNQQTVIGELNKMEQEYQIQRAQAEKRTVDAILLEEKLRAAETIKHLKEIGASEEELAAARTTLEKETALKVAEAQKERLQEMANNIEGFIHRILGGARSFKDVLKNIFQEIKEFFIRKVIEMVAAWLLGLKKMQSGAGGILGGLIGVIFGRGGGTTAGGGGINIPGLPSPGPPSPIGTPTFPGFGFGLSTAPVGATGTSKSPMRSAAGLVAAGGGLPAPHDVFGGIDVGGGFGGGGGGFVGSGGGSSFSWKSILGVAALGAAIGFGEWAKTKAAKKNKRRAAELIAFQGLDQILTTFENYTRWQMDFDSALSNVQSTWADMLKGWRELGRKYLKKYQGLHQGKYDQIIGDLKRIEGIRQQRLFSMSLIGVPEFETGGMVRQITAHNGRLLAILHEGEAVLNRGAVQQLGPQVIEQINRGGTSAPSFEHGGLVGGAAAARGDVHIEVNITPAPGMNEEQLARYTIRKLRRELKDRGLQLGG